MRLQTRTIRAVRRASPPRELRVTARSAQNTLCDGASHLARDLREGSEPLLERRMRHEELRGRLLDVRRDDEERVHPLNLAQVALRDPRNVAGDLLQRAHQVLGRTGDDR